MGAARAYVTAAAVLAAIACGAPSRPAPVAKPAPTGRVAAPAADCGDRIDPNDACPLLDGCARDSHRDAGTDEDDGCPGAGGIPFASTCHEEDRRFAAFAAEIARRPSLTTLRIVSSVTGCAQRVRDGLERAGVAAARLEAVTRGAPDPCDDWVRFEIAAWDGRRCEP
jgi:hypothetical protein